jgi:acid phosphatase family membrane protein YuiD
MKDFRIWNIFFNPVLVASLAAQFSSQLFKVIKPVFRGKRPDVGKLADYGGFPSAHTAFIAACAASIGVTEGFGSGLFALAAVVASILIYDIVKLRKTVELNGRETDRLLENSKLERLAELPQFRAHSTGEILGGMAWGVAWAILICLVW